MDLEAGLDQALGNGSGAFLGVHTLDCGSIALAAGEAAPGQPLTPDHLFRIGSVTKTFVAATVLQLADEGVVSLDDPIADYVPNVPNGDLVTVHMALDHQSGIFNYTNDSAFMSDVFAHPATVWQPSELIAVAAGNDPYFEPGQGWEYSNTNYIALGLLIETVTGQPLATVLHERLFDPFSLDDLALDDLALDGQMAHGYLKDGTDVTFTFDQSWAWAAGAMIGSVDDLLDWSQALYGGDVLSADAKAAMFQTVPTGVPGYSYGLGMFELAPSVAYVETVGHMGDTLGYHTHMFYIPELETSLVSAVTSDAADVNAISIAALEVLLTR